MAETWWLDGDSALPLSAAEALDLLRRRIAAGLLETWLGSSEGRALALVTNTERAHVTLLDDEDDPGQHVVDPGARGSAEPEAGGCPQARACPQARRSVSPRQ
ncbi:hypothetical protein [Streptomyces sp. B1-3]|uniref:hypothetical protein n=1 Tax=Streptomyces sp. B1-3 TaxID=3141453 RepID=UPI003D2E31C6